MPHEIAYKGPIIVDSFGAQPVGHPGGLHHARSSARPQGATARQLLFEHSPGRGNPKFTADYTVFDALIRYSDVHGRNGFVA